MCGPAAVPLMVAMTAASTYVAVDSAGKQAAYQSGVAKTNEINANYAAADATRRGELAAIKVNQQTAQLQGQQRAMFAARGLDLTEGTPGDILDQTSFFGKNDAATTRYNAGVESWQQKSKAAGYGAAAGAAQFNGQMAQTGSLLSGASKVAGYWYKGSTPTASLRNPEDEPV